MIVQIYTVQSADEALAVANLGVHHIGVTPSQRGLPGEVDYATARVILAALPATVKKIALSVEEDLAEVVGMVAAVQPEVLHLCGDLAAVPPKAVSDLRLRLPGVEIMQAIPVSGPQAIQDALDYQDVADYLLLDSKSEQVTGIGATGETHDWNISRAIVQASRKPVILAGGLSSHNVAEAIRVVRPWGVDSLTHTNLPLGGGRFRKDLDAVRAFVQAALAEEVR